MQSFDFQPMNESNSFKSPFFHKKFLKGYSKIHELKLVSIGLASPEKIQSWAEKELPNGKIFGEVTNANTFHYRTFQPTKGGLFCERIFGPLKDFECACGKRQKPTALESKKILEHKQTTRYFCSNCDVEYTWSIIRRYQLGYIKLNAPVTHLWYLKTNPSYLSIFFDMKRKDLEALVYCTDSLTIENVWKSMDQKTNFFNSMTDRYIFFQKNQKFSQKTQNFERYFQNKKQFKSKQRNTFLSLMRKKSSQKNWKIVDFFFTASHSFPQEKLQFILSQKVQEQKKHVLVSFLFEKIVQKKVKKTYKNIFVTTYEKQFCFDFHFLRILSFLLAPSNAENNGVGDLPHNLSLIESPLFALGQTMEPLSQNLAQTLFWGSTQKLCWNQGGMKTLPSKQNLLFLKSLFSPYFSQEKQIETVFLSFFFLFQFSGDMCLNTKSTEKNFKNKYILTKKTFLVFFFLVSFFKKQRRFFDFEAGSHAFFSEKKGKKRQFLSFFVKKPKNLKQLIEFLFETQFTRSDSQFGKIFSSKSRPGFGSGLTNLSFGEGASGHKSHKADALKQRSKHPTWSPHLDFGGAGQNSLTFFFSKKKMDFFVEGKHSFFEKRETSFFLAENQENTNFEEKLNLRVSNIFIHSKKKRISQKKQKKTKEFGRSCSYFGIQNMNSFNLESKKKEKTQNFFGQKKRKKHSKNETQFLTNPVFTTSSYFLWKNDSDWKYFAYYNSFFFSEFQDIPISEQGGTSTFFSEVDIRGRISTAHNSQKHARVGAGILEKLLTEYTPQELKKTRKQHQIVLPRINQVIRSLKETMTTKKDSLKIQKYIQKREHIVRRLKFLGKFYRKNSNPTFMILRNLPVLPPDLRPIVKLQNQIAASDLNRFYQRILYRNERLHKFSKDSATNQSFEIRYAQRLLQEAVDNLIQNGKGGVKPETNSRGIPLKSFSDILKGKQGRFRQYLLGKRVDYSGRSVIVVGPKLKLYECGLPKEMAFELFLPFLIQQILQLKLAKTVVGAKNILKKDSDFAFSLLKKIMKNIPVLLNRAPTLHRLGFQAFLPKLVEGRAILLHPMVCPGFNADFDGDQMAVHVPLTVEARTEAWTFMLSTNNLLNSATGDPVLLPTQDMVLGCYYLTTDFSSKSATFEILNSLRKKQNTRFYEFQKQKKSFFSFSSFFEVFSAYQRKEISFHSPVWIRWNALVDFGNDFSKPVEIQLRKNGSWQKISPKTMIFFNQKNEIFSQFIQTTPGRIFMNFIIQEFQKKKESVF